MERSRKNSVVLYPGPALWPAGFPVELQGLTPSTWDVPEIESSAVLFPPLFVGRSSTSTGTGSTPVPPAVTQDPEGVDDPADPPAGGFPRGTPGGFISVRNVGNSGGDPWPPSRPVPVPEPSVLLMLGLGGAAVLALRRH